MTTFEVHITPEMAKEWLDKQGLNRPYKQAWVDQYARAMKAGEWKLTHQGIAFAKNGELKDGQHRLMAIIKANVPVNMMVTYGIDDDCMEFIDSGNIRKLSDRMVLAGKSYMYRSTHTQAIAKFLDARYRGFKDGMKYSLEELCESIDYWYGICAYISAMCNRKYRAHTPIIIALIRAMVNGMPEYKAEAFLQAYTRFEIDTSIPNVNWKPVLDAGADKTANRSSHVTTVEKHINDYMAIINAFDKNLKRVLSIENRYPVTLIDMKKWSDDHIDTDW